MTALVLIGSGFLGGLILNAMPCVLPPLCFKLSHLLEHAQLDEKTRRRVGLFYFAGTLSIFWLFSALVIGLRYSGEQFGWGMQMQSPGFIITLLLVTFLFTLNTFDLFEIPGYSTQSGGEESPLRAAYIDGLFVTLLSIPCSAPFLGSAVTAALATEQSWWGTLGLFSSVAAGLASPVILICQLPTLYRWLPRPGAWMKDFKRFVAFSLLATSAWLFSQYQAIVGADQGIRGLYFLCLLATYFWGKSLWSTRRGLGRWLLELSALTLLVGGGRWATSDATSELPWVDFSPSALQQRLDRGQPVFVDFTADWCVSCKAFEAAHLNRSSTRRVFDESGVTPMKADLTINDDALWARLRGLGRSGLPTYVLYNPDGSHELFPDGPPLGLKAKLLALGSRFPKSTFKPLCPVTPTQMEPPLSEE